MPLAISENKKFPGAVIRSPLECTGFHIICIEKMGAAEGILAFPPHYLGLPAFSSFCSLGSVEHHLLDVIKTNKHSVNADFRENEIPVFGSSESSLERVSIGFLKQLNPLEAFSGSLLRSRKPIYFK